MPCRSSGRRSCSARSGTRRHRRRPRPIASRSLDEIRDGLRLVIHDPVLRAFAGAQMALSALWGIFGATWFLFVLDELRLEPWVLGVVAGVGGFSSFLGAIVAARATRRWGIGPVAIWAMVLSAIGNAFIPLAPAGLAVSGDRLSRDAAARGRLGGHRLRHHRGRPSGRRSSAIVRSAGWRPRSRWHRALPSSWRRSARVSWPRRSACGRLPGSPRSVDCLRH